MKKQEGIIERLCKYLGRQNLATGLLDFIGNRMFPQTQFAYGGISSALIPTNKQESLNDSLSKPLLMARPPAGTENFRGPAPTSPHKGHTQPAPITLPTLLSFIPIIGPVLHQEAKTASQHASKACADPLYKGMHGAPCKYEGGSDNKCPKGTVSGWWWSYEVPGKGRIYYVDCCGGSPTHSVFCNWSSEPNWCYGYGKAQAAGIGKYNCTLAILEADMKVKAVGSGYEVEGVDP